MKKSIYLILTLLASTLLSCNDKIEPGPDYASKLIGEFNIGYVIIDKNTKEIVTSKYGESKLAKISLQRKNNYTLMATIIIDDANIKLTENFEIDVSESYDQTNPVGKPGFISKYKISISMPQTVYFTDWSLYEDGSIIGSFQYDGDEKKIEIFSIGS
jgi:hypothetical protein